MSSPITALAAATSFRHTKISASSGGTNIHSSGHMTLSCRTPTTHTLYAYPGVWAPCGARKCTLSIAHSADWNCPGL